MNIQQKLDQLITSITGSNRIALLHNTGIIFKIT